jgi:hypothetical protein
MAVFTTYAEVVTPEHDSMKAFIAGVKKNPPGLALADVLKHTGGVYETTMHLSDRVRERLRQVAELTSDERLLSISRQSEVPVSLEHLRHMDPQTVIVIGFRWSLTPEESEALGPVDRAPRDPKTGFEIP